MPDPGVAVAQGHGRADRRRRRGSPLVLLAGPGPRRRRPAALRPRARGRLGPAGRAVQPAGRPSVGGRTDAGRPSASAPSAGSWMAWRESDSVRHPAVHHEGDRLWLRPVAVKAPAGAAVTAGDGAAESTWPSATAGTALRDRTSPPDGTAAGPPARARSTTGTLRPAARRRDLRRIRRPRHRLLGGRGRRRSGRDDLARRVDVAGPEPRRLAPSPRSQVTVRAARTPLASGETRPAVASRRARRRADPAAAQPPRSPTATRSRSSGYLTLDGRRWPASRCGSRRPPAPAGDRAHRRRRPLRDLVQARCQRLLDGQARRRRAGRPSRVRRGHRAVAPKVSLTLSTRRAGAGYVTVFAGEVDARHPGEHRRSCSGSRAAPGGTLV